MSAINRREFIRLLGAGAVLGGSGLPLLGRSAVPKAKVVIVGGGYGGATVAKYLSIYDSAIDVTLIERSRQFVSCPMSNEVLGGERSIDTLTFNYSALAGRGVYVVHDEANEIDANKKQVTTQGGETFAYDFLVVSPGIAFRWGAIDGYDDAASQLMPHAWKAGEQTLLLRKRLEAMADGGTVMIAAPPNPFRCPPGPYERASQIAHYLKYHKSKSKLIILDAKDRFSKQGLFVQGWEEHYKGLIEWRSKANDGQVLAVDPKRRVLVTEFGEHEPTVANVIPPQKAGAIAERAGLTDDSGWCPVDQRTFESTLQKGVYVIGDACVAGAMPKSGYSANSQGKVAAAAIATRVNAEPMPEPSYINTCYSLITPNHGISVAMVYHLVGGEIVGVEGAGGLSPADGEVQLRAREAAYARSWFKNITNDIFG